MLIEKARDATASSQTQKERKPPKPPPLTPTRITKPASLALRQPLNGARSEVAGQIRVLVATFPTAKNIFRHRIVTRKKERFLFLKLIF